MKNGIDYQIGRYHIRINLWYLIIFLVVQTLLNELGFWQLSRAKEKQVRLIQLEKGSNNPLTSLAEVDNASLAQFKALKLNVEINSFETFFLDNKTYNKAPGYHVLTTAVDRASGKKVLLNRGWIFGGEDRTQLPELELVNQSPVITGRLYPIKDRPTSGLSGEIEKLSSGVRIPSLDTEVIQQLEKEFGLTLEPYVIRLNEDSPIALNTHWIWTNMPVEKHLAYAIQWFALALAFLVISIVVAVKKR